MRLAGDRRRRGPLWGSSCGVSEELLVNGDAHNCLFCLQLMQLLSKALQGLAEAGGPQSTEPEHRAQNTEHTNT